MMSTEATARVYGAGCNERFRVIAHISIGVKNIDRVKHFYDAALRPLGYKCLRGARTSVGYGFGVDRHTTAIGAWNLFGAADLALAIAFGITSAEGSPLQVFPGPGSEAMQHAPWSFVPTVLVPIWLILHAIIAVQLRRAKIGQVVGAFI